jgi:hypothetical protein
LSEDLQSCLFITKKEKKKRREEKREEKENKGVRGAVQQQPRVLSSSNLLDRDLG